MENKNNFYYGSFIKNLKKNNVLPTDTIHSVMLKLEGSANNINSLPKIKTFLRKYWSFEKTILNSAYSNLENNIILDPATTSTPLAIKGQSFVLFEDTIFSKCKCNGRVFPEFDNCTFCNEKVTSFIPSNSLFQELSSGNDDLRRSRKGNKRKFMFASFEDKGIFLDDGEVFVTYADLKNELKNLDNIIP